MGEEEKEDDEEQEEEEAAEEEEGEEVCKGVFWATPLIIQYMIHQTWEVLKSTGT